MCPVLYLNLYYTHLKVYNIMHNTHLKLVYNIKHSIINIHNVHKTFLYIFLSHISRCILPKTKNFDCVGRGDLTSLLFSKVAK